MEDINTTIIRRNTLRLKPFLLTLILITVFSLVSFAKNFNPITNQLQNENEVNDTKEKQPTYYRHFKENKVSFTAFSYRLIKLDDATNIILEMPDTDNNTSGNEYKSLSQLLFDKTRSGEFKAYPAKDLHPIYKNSLGWENMKQRMDAQNDTILIVEEKKGISNKTVFEREVNTHEIKEYLIQEMNMHNTKGEVIAKRIIGICPIRVFNRIDETGMQTDEVLRSMVAWFKFSDIQEELAKWYVLDPNTRSYTSYNDFFVEDKFEAIDFKTWFLSNDWYSWFEQQPDSLYNYCFPVYPQKASGYASEFFEQVKGTTPQKSSYNFTISTSNKKDTSAGYASTQYVYKKLELKYKGNSILYLPGNDVYINDFNSLAATLLNGLRDKKFNAYEYLEGEYEVTGNKLDSLAIEKAFGYRLETVEVYDVETGYAKLHGIVIPANPAAIKSYIIKERQYLNKKGKVLGTEIESLLPVFHIQEMYSDEQLSATAWINFSEAVQYLLNNYIYKIDYKGYTSFYDVLTGGDLKVGVVENVFLEGMD